MSAKTVTVNSSGGIGLGGAVFLVFLVLKLTGYINWSWWWVTAPLWAPPLLILTVLLVGALGIAVWHFTVEPWLKPILDKRRRRLQAKRRAALLARRLEAQRLRLEARAQGRRP